MNKIVIFLFLFVVRFTASDNILIVHSVIVQSHVYTLRKLAHSLAAVGHEITIIRMLEIDPPKVLNTNKIEEYTFSINNSKGELALFTKEEEGKFLITDDLLWNNGLSLTVFESYTFNTLVEYCNALLGNEVILNKLNSKNYSVAIVDLIFNDCGLAIANKLGIPIIGYWGFYFTSGPLVYTSGFNLPSSVPQTVSHLTEKMTFRQRIWNTMTCITLVLFLKVQTLFTVNAIQQYIPNSPHPTDLYRELSGVLIDSHPAFDIPQSLPASFIKIGGIHMEKAKPLPPKIMKFIDDAGDAGVILFSLGALLDSKNIPGDVFNGYFNVFSRLKQKVIVKSKAFPKNISNNILILPFVPQLDILANEKTKLFITHGGIKGVTESLYHAVPMVGIPVFGDQMDNVVHLKSLGVATQIDKESSEEIIYNNIQEVLQHQSYKDVAIRISKQIKAHPDPKRLAVDFIQIVLQTNGANHLKMESRHLNMFQYLCLDIISFFLILLIGLFAAIYYVVRFNFFQKTSNSVSGSQAPFNKQKNRNRKNL